MENFEAMIGRKVLSIDGGKVGDDTMTFNLDDGSKHTFCHFQDCCESVSIDDITGELSDLIGEELLMAEDVSSDYEDDEDDRGYESCTWTFYKFATRKGYVTVKWLGQSNGYYSESVSYVVDKPVKAD